MRITGVGGKLRFGVLGVVIQLVVLLSAMAGCSPGGNIQGPYFREVLLQGEGKSKIVLIDIYGPISNQPMMIPNIGTVPGMTGRIRQELELAYEDRDVRAVLLRINSPGGTLTDSDIIYHSIVEFKKSKKVKVIASLGDIAASGAVYIAMAADEIIAHPTTITGSIGVILPFTEYAGLMEKLGITTDPVTSGQFKDIDSPYRKRTKEEKKMLQELVDAQHQQFVNVIRTGRKHMSRKEVEALADGRIFSAQVAKEKGLIDDIGYLDDAYKRLQKISGHASSRLVRYANAWATGNNIYSSAFPVEIGGQ